MDLQFWKSLENYRTSDEWVMKKIQKTYAEKLLLQKVSDLKVEEAVNGVRGQDGVVLADLIDSSSRVEKEK